MDLSTVELILISSTLESCADEESCARFKHLFKAITDRIDAEVRSRGKDEYLTALETMANVDPEFMHLYNTMKKTFDGLEELKNMKLKL